MEREQENEQERKRLKKSEVETDAYRELERNFERENNGAQFQKRQYKGDGS